MYALYPIYSIGCSPEWHTPSRNGLQSMVLWLRSVKVVASPLSLGAWMYDFRFVHRFVCTDRAYHRRCGR